MNTRDRYEKSLVRDVFREVKETCAKRKELVLRVEMVRRALHRKLPLQHINDKFIGMTCKFICFFFLFPLVRDCDA